MCGMTHTHTHTHTHTQIEREREREYVCIDALRVCGAVCGVELTFTVVGMALLMVLCVW